MSTMIDLISETKRITYGSLNDQINLVGTAYTAGDDTLVLELDVTGITAGMMISSGLNVWYTKGIDVATRSVFVIPGYNNSPKKDALVGDFVYIKPRVTDWYLFETINREILRLSSPQNGLYKIGSWTAAIDTTYQTYAVPAEALNMVGLLRVRYLSPGSTDLYVDIPSNYYRVQTGVTSTIVRLLINIPSGTSLEFLYKAPFSAAVNLSDNIESVCGLTNTMLDIPPLGAYSTLLMTTDSSRNQIQTQGDARRANEVAAGSNNRAGLFVDEQYRSRVSEEVIRLIQRVPFVRSI